MVGAKMNADGWLIEECKICGLKIKFIDDCGWGCYDWKQKV
jgi:hypothetical protein